MESAKNNYQKQFFEKLKNSVSLNINLAYELANVLKISNDAAYRRLRGEKLLNFDEIVILCQHFNIGVDEFINGNLNEIRFNYMPLQDHFEDNYMVYIKSLRDYLRIIVTQKSSRKAIYSAATDIPIFYLCNFPELKAFKIYTWQKQFGKGCNLKFSIERIVTPDMISIFSEISDLYNRIDSTEVWTHNTIDSYLKSIQYFYEIDCFESKENAILILDKLSALIEILKSYGESGFKMTSCGQKKKFSLFLSEIELDNSLIYAETDDLNMSFIKLYSINTISTSNPLFCSGTKLWLNSIINKSALISGFSQKQFVLFFKETTRKIEQLRARILSNNL